LEFKGVNCCEKCGYNESNSSLDFHHIDFNEKDFMIGDNYLTYKNVADLTTILEAELNKCVVICKNCHKIEHSDIEFFEANKEKIIEKSQKLREIQPKINRNNVEALYKSGLSQKDISKYLNAHKSTISAIIKELDLK
jgi:hypothetical protein